MIEIAQNVYIETAYAPLTLGAIHTSSGWVLVDVPPYAQDAEAWQEALRARSDRRVCAVILTGAYFDRAIGTAWIEAPVVAHDSAAAYLREQGAAFSADAAEMLARDADERVALAGAGALMPDISFEGEIWLHYGETSIQLNARPCGAVGSLWAALPDLNVLFVGDAITSSLPPIIQTPTTKQWLNTLTTLRRERYADWTIVTGRNGVLQAGGTEPLAEYLRTARRRVYSLLRAGEPRARLADAAAELLAAYPPAGAGGEPGEARIRRGLDVIYDELAPEFTPDSEG